jgi:hypothetical protein
VVCDGQLALAISTSIGTYSNPPLPPNTMGVGGLNTLTYSWTSAMNVLIVNAPPDPVPGGVPPSVTVGATWPENAYSFAALVAANPAAVLIDAYAGQEFPPAPPPAFPVGANGLPVGAITPSILLVSGDSGNVTKSGKHILSFFVNGTNVLV